MDQSEHSFADPPSQDGSDSVVDPFPSDLADATPEQLAAIHAILDLAAASTSANASASTGANSGSMPEDQQHAPLLPDPSQLAMPLSPSITGLFAHQHLLSQQHGHPRNDQQGPVAHDFLLQSTSRHVRQAEINRSDDQHALTAPHILAPGPLSPTGGQLIVSTTRPSTAESSSSAPGLAELGAQDGPASSVSLAHLQSLLLNSPLSPAISFTSNPFGYAPFLDHEQTAAAVLAMATAMNQDVQQQHGRSPLSAPSPNHSVPDSPMPSESNPHAPQPALPNNAGAAVALLHARSSSLASPALSPQTSPSTHHSTTASHYSALPHPPPLAPPSIPYFAAFPPRVSLTANESRYHSTPLLDPLYATVEKLAAKSNIPGFKHEDRIAASEVLAAHRDEMRLLCESVESACLNDQKLQDLTAVGAYNEFNDDLDQPDTTLFELMHKRFVLRPAAVLNFNDYMIQFQQHLSAHVWDSSPLVHQALGIRTPTAREQLRKAQQLYVEFAADMSRSFQDQYDARRDLVMRTQAALPMFSCAHSRSWAPPFPHVRNLDTYFAHIWNQTESKLAATFILWLQEIKSHQLSEDMEPVAPLTEEQLKDVPLPSLVGSRSSRKRADQFDPSVLAALRASYTHERYPTEEERLRLARLCNLTVHQVSVWFTNRRQRERTKEKKRQRRDASLDRDLIVSPAASPVAPAPLSPTSAPTASAALQKLLNAYYSPQPFGQPPMSAPPSIASSVPVTHQVPSPPSASTATTALPAQAKRQASDSAASPGVARTSQCRRAASREPIPSAPPPTSTSTKVPPIVLDSANAQQPFTYPLGSPIIPPHLPGFPFPFGHASPFAAFPPPPFAVPYHAPFGHTIIPHGQMAPPQPTTATLQYPPTIPHPPVPISATGHPPTSQPNHSQAPQQPPPPPPPPQPALSPLSPPHALYNPFQLVQQQHPDAAVVPFGSMDQATAAFLQQQQQYAYLLSMAALGSFGVESATSKGAVPNPMPLNEAVSTHGADAQDPCGGEGRPSQ